eukprot:jgi/Chrzof1/2565/Cz11g20160.t1
MACPGLGPRRLSRQNPWPTIRLTRRQKTKFQMNAKMRSSEMGRSLDRRPLIQASLMPAAAGQPGTNPVLKYARQHVLLGQPSPASVSDAAASTHPPVVRDQASFPIKGTPAGLKAVLGSNLWALDRPAAIPGVVRLRRPNSIEKGQREALRALKVFMGGVRTRYVKKLLQISDNLGRPKPFGGSATIGRVWSMHSAIESLAPIAVTKVGFAPSVPAGKMWVSHARMLCNGHPVHAAWTACRPGDVWSMSDKASTAWAQQLSGALRLSSAKFLGRSPLIGNAWSRHWARPVDPSTGRYGDRQGRYGDRQGRYGDRQR